MKRGTASSNPPLHTSFLVFPSWLLENESHTQYSSDMAEEPLRLSPLCGFILSLHTLLVHVCSVRAV